MDKAKGGKAGKGGKQGIETMDTHDRKRPQTTINSSTVLQLEVITTHFCVDAVLLLLLLLSLLLC